MLQVLQSLADGTTRLVETPVPYPSAVELVVQTRASVVSAGTERMLVNFGRANWINKARQQPDRVKQVLDKVRTDGVATTVAAVRAKLDAPIALGCCHAGRITEVGSRVERLAVGDRVVTNGPHAEYVRVPHTLAARIPDAVSFETAAFTPLAAIGLQGLRLAMPTVGETIVVYGLGLIGLLTVQIARAAGCKVIGIDRAANRCELAEKFGADVIEATADVDVAAAVLTRTDGDGADAVLLTLATEDNEPARAAAAMCRKRGRIVLVGVAGLSLRRDDFYKKELTFQVSCSYGPGRYDPQHEDQGIDYPLAYVRWTEGRNFAAVLALMAEGKIDPSALISHRFGIADAPRAYEIVGGAEPSLGIVLNYAEKAAPSPADRTVTLRSYPAPQEGSDGVVGWIGAGNYASRVLIPAFAGAGATLEVIASAGGTSASVVGGAAGFRRATTATESLFEDALIDTIVVATRHDSHADWTARALDSGRHVFVEKPLALKLEDLDRVREAAETSRRVLCVGYNRRFAPMIGRAKRALAVRSGPLAISILVNAGALPGEHWTQNREIGGGRIVGDACHLIDLARYLVGASITGLGVATALAAGRPREDVASLQLSFQDGSIATVQYFSNGHPALPKERVECFFDGKALRIDNYRRFRTWGIAGLSDLLPQPQDKGARGLVGAFMRAVRGSSPPPIPLDEVLEVALWSIRAGELAARGGGFA